MSIIILGMLIYSLIQWRPVFVNLPSALEPKQFEQLDFSRQNPQCFLLVFIINNIWTGQHIEVITGEVEQKQLNRSSGLNNRFVCLHLCCNTTPARAACSKGSPPTRWPVRACGRFLRSHWPEPPRELLKTESLAADCWEDRKLITSAQTSTPAVHLGTTVQTQRKILGVIHIINNDLIKSNITFKMMSD